MFLERCETPPDLAFAGAMPSLCELTIHRCATLECLDGIERLPNLKAARFVNCPQLADLSALRRLGSEHSLLELQVVNTAVADMEPIGCLSGLVRPTYVLQRRRGPAVWTAR